MQLFDITEALTPTANVLAQSCLLYTRGFIIATTISFVVMFISMLWGALVLLEHITGIYLFLMFSRSTFAFEWIVGWGLRCWYLGLSLFYLLDAGCKVDISNRLSLGIYIVLRWYKHLYMSTGVMNFIINIWIFSLNG